MRSMSSALRKLVLTTHVTSSVGWLGAVAVFLALAFVGLTGRDSQGIRSAYIAMNLTAWLVILPLGLLSPLTGLASSFGTTWGLFRHYWIIAKLFITIPSTLLLFLHLQPISRMARVAAQTPLMRGDFGMLRAQLLFEAAAAMLVLLAATALSVYKPAGRTQWSV